MSNDLSFQVDIALRLLLAALLGAAMGLEREIHGHQAGMRTHMLVSLGSAAFTVLSIYAFPTSLGQGTSDPSRIAAQIVTGIGFLGAGAIIKYGTNIRGLTTAASLWVVASVGLAAGAGAYFVALVSAALAVVALWPLHIFALRLQVRIERTMRLQLSLGKLDSLDSVSRVLVADKVQILRIGSRKSKRGHEIQLDIRMPAGDVSHRILEKLEALPGVDVISLAQIEEA